MPPIHSGRFNYYKDLSQRLKNRELDMVIVVNMFLTGFDAKTLNTLFVDKNLRDHGLIQAFSRTNRILNSVKTYGNIVSFRNLEENTNKALQLFGNKDAHSVVLLKPFHDYYNQYAAKVSELLKKFPLTEPILGERAEKEFISLYGAILKLENILVSFDEFAGQEIFTARQAQDYKSWYLDYHAAYTQTRDGEKVSIEEDVVFEIELIKHVEINVDYILMLVEKYKEEHANGHEREILTEISRAVDASPTLRNKKDLIEEFIDTISLDADSADEWETYITAKKEAELQTIIEEEKLRPEPAKQYLANAFRNGTLRTTGVGITKILPPKSRFTPDNAHTTTRTRIFNKLQNYFNRFLDLAPKQQD